MLNFFSKKGWKQKNKNLFLPHSLASKTTFEFQTISVVETLKQPMLVTFQNLKTFLKKTCFLLIALA